VDNIFVQSLDGSPGHQITKFTSQHNAVFQWSQDGKTLAVARTQDIPTGSDTQILPPTAALYHSLTFSPDGNYVYFSKAGISSQSECDLYRTPVLGGTPQLILRDLDTGITFSPDGRRICSRQ
jgi:Tol biopolymer transport system component